MITCIFVAASCQKENINEETSAYGYHFAATIEDGVCTKTTVERVTSPSVAYKTKWESADQININGAVYTATPRTDATKADFNYSSGSVPSAPYSAYYPATMYDGSSASLPASYTYAEGKYNMPMYAESSSATLSFKNLCGVLAITVPSTQITSVSTITVISDQQMNGAFTATSEGVLTFETKSLVSADKKVTLTFTSPITIEGSVTFYIPVPAGTHNPLTINVSNGSIMRTMVTEKSGGVEVIRNTVYPIAFSDNQPDMLPGLFSVSASTQVRFAKGNCYADSTVCDDKGHFDWYFENSQYSCQDYFDDEYPRYVYWTDHWNYGAGAGSDYWETDSESVDWGVPYCLYNTLPAGTWRTLTGGNDGEWKYLIEGRTNSSSKVGYATVAGMQGIIILPDSFTDPMKNGGSGAFVPVSTGTTYSLNVYVAGEQWNAMETAGAVFLPAAGYYGSSGGGGGLLEHGSSGYYWSSTCATKPNAYGLSFDATNGIRPAITMARNERRSIRLVSVVQ